MSAEVFFAIVSISYPMLDINNVIELKYTFCHEYKRNIQL
jgi:hypothetical protein